MLPSEKEQANAERQLGNEAFLGKAPAAVVDGLRKRAAELASLIPKTRAALDSLG
jgi:valyl-tRNA synthetase